MRVLVCGDRHWENYVAILRKLSEFPAGTVVIEGEAKGADLLARRAAVELGFPVEPFPAEWSRYGRAAGPIRNEAMLTEGLPDRVLAFHANISESKGTANMVALARKAGVPVEIFTG